MTSLTIKLNGPPMKKAKTRLEKTQANVVREMVRTMQRIGDESVRFLKRNTPRSDGDLEGGQNDHVADGWTRQTVRTPEGNVRVSVINANPRWSADLGGYTLGDIIEFGSAPHEITPKNKSTLRFMGAMGSFVFTKKVQHPGTKPTGVVQSAQEKMLAKRPRIFAAAKRALEKSVGAN